MRNISMAVNIKQIKDRSKTVTRRRCWRDVKPGELLQTCEKCQGLKSGERLSKLRVIRVISKSYEPLKQLIEDPIYGRSEARREGFGEMSGMEFAYMFCKKMRVNLDFILTRIEFEYVD